MEWRRGRQVLGSFSLGGGSFALWWAFERQMCLGAGGCAPNIVYLVPGVVAVLLGVGLIKLRSLTLISGILAASTILYGLFAVVVQGETLFIGFLFLLIAFLLAALALGSEALRAYYEHRQSTLIRAE